LIFRITWIGNSPRSLTVASVSEWRRGGWVFYRGESGIFLQADWLKISVPLFKTCGLAERFCRPVRYSPPNDPAAGLEVD
jgi:hypothetical protein